MVALDGTGTGTGSSPEGEGDERPHSSLDLPLESGIGDEGGSSSCRADLALTTLQPVYLGFAFDVSGSMGKLDEPWHDPTLKWDPVVAATKAFFADASSSGIEASLSFFPTEDDRCDAESYDPLDVPLTPLPSERFAAAIDDITPESEDDWRGGTPTLAVTQATLAFLEDLAEASPAARYVYVLVSDGYPQGCDDDEEDNIETTVAAVADARDRILTYVVGVRNPPGGPDTVTNLNAVAEAGGSDRAFFVETGDPTQTASDFKAAIETIRANVASCTLAIPPPPNGEELDPDELNVTYNQLQLGYDQDCALTRGWRYDDPERPSSIVLCSEVCAQVQADPTRELAIEYGCDTRPAIP